MSAHNWGRVYLLAGLIIVLTGIGGCEEQQLSSSLGVVRGTVRDGDGKPLSSVTVRVAGSNYSALTNGDGRYLMNLPTGDYRLEASKSGFKPLSLPVRLQAERLDNVLDFTIIADDPSVGPSLELETKGERFLPGDEVLLALVVRNEGEETLKPRLLVFQASDARGRILWRHETREPGEIGAGSSKSYNAAWDWYSQHTATIVSGGEIACTAWIESASGRRCKSNDCSVLLEVPATSPGRLRFRTLEKGSLSGIPARLGLAIRTEEDFREFWRTHAPSRPLPEVNFDEETVIAAMGGRVSTWGSTVEIESVETMASNRPDADSGEDAAAAPLLCTVVQRVPASTGDAGDDGTNDVNGSESAGGNGDSAETPTSGNTDRTRHGRCDFNAPYHIIACRRFDGRLRFEWRLERTETDGKP